MSDHRFESATPVSGWNSLYRIGGAAALLAGIVFRRNLGAEIAIFSPIHSPTSPGDWLQLIQTHRLIGLMYLGIFDLVNMLLVGILLLALYITLRQINPVRALIAVVLGLQGVTVYLASNTALSMLALSDQYAASSSEAQRSLLLSAAQALLALNRFSSVDAHPGSGGYASLLLVAAAGFIFSTTLLKPIPQNPLFSRWVAWVGILANSLDLMYCLALLFCPSAVYAKLAMIFLPAAGFLLMAWHILVGVRMLQFARRFRHQRE